MRGYRITGLAIVLAARSLIYLYGGVTLFREKLLQLLVRQYQIHV